MSRLLHRHLTFQERRYMVGRQQQYMRPGGLYPSGRSPMVLDFQDTSRAITERLIKREQERISQEKGYMQESQKAILDALSFEAVQGASDAMQLKHLENLNKTHDKWAKIYAESDGKLSMPQLAELQKEKRKVEAERMNMQTNVKNFELVQKEILSDPQAKKWDSSSHERFAELAKSNRVGDPTVNWLEVLSPRQRDLSEMLDDELVGYKEQLLANIDINGYTPNEDGTITWNENNRRLIDSTFNAMFNSRAGQDIFRQYGGTEEAKARMKNEFESTAIRDRRQAKFDYRAMPKEGNTSEIANKYGWKNLSQSQIDNMVYFNDFAEKVLRLDQNTLNLLKTSNITGVGVPAAVEIVDDYIMVTGKKPASGSPPFIRIPIPKDRTNKQEVRDFKLSLLRMIPALGSKQVPSNIASYVVEDWDEVATTVPASPMRLNSINKILETGKLSSVMSDTDGKTMRKEVADRIKQLVPDAQVRTLNIGERVLITTDGKEVEYSMKREEDRKKLQKWIGEQVDWEGRVKRLSPMQLEQQEAAEEIPMLDEESKQGMRDNIAKAKAGGLDFNGFVDKAVESSGKSEDWVREMLEKNGVTEDNY